MRKWALLAGGLLAGGVVAEGVCRLTVPNPITGPADADRNTWRVEGLVTDPLVEFSFEPGFAGRMSVPGDYDVPFRISAQGLRDEALFAPEHEGSRRILLVGDSFVFGIGLELRETLGERLEAALNADGSGGPPVEVVPVGAPGYGLDDYSKLVERWVPRVRPDLVVVALYTGNDLLDYELKARDRRVVIEGRLVKERQAWSWGLRRYSILAHLLLQRFNTAERIDRTRPLHPTPQDLARIFRSMQPWLARLARTAGGSGTAAAGPAPADADATGSAGPPVALWLLYEKHTVLNLRRGNATYSVPPLAGVVAEFRRLGGRVLEPVGAWVAAPDPVSQYFFAKDAHYSPAGAALMADWLAPRLRAAYAQRLGAGPARAVEPEPAAR